MLTNKQKYDYYVKVYHRIERGWTKGALGYPGGSACLVGAINYAVTGKEAGEPRYSDWTGQVPGSDPVKAEIATEMQVDLATQLYTTEKRFLVKSRPLKPSEVDRSRSADGGLRVIEDWNDSAGRHKAEVLAAIQKRIDHYKPLVRDEEVARLRAEIASLTTQLGDARKRITELETQVAQLKNENVLLRKSKTNYTAAQLRAESTALRELDEHLNAVTEELAGWGVSA